MKLLFLCIAFLFTISSSFSQEDSEETAKPSRRQSDNGFQTGMLLGSLFANKQTAHLYDGYGYDVNGVKNTFLNSFMYQKIVIEYGGGNGQPDQIAQQLNVNPGEWAFDQTDMPVNMKYNPSFIIGLNMRWATSKRASVLLNINASKLTLNGNFTIQLLTQPIGPTQPGYQNFKIFSITGSEQRVVFQLGLQRILGEDEVFGVIVEGGPLLNMVKFSSNQITINTLQIDLTTFYNQYGYETYKAKNLTGVSFGAFGGIGVNMNTNARWAIQLIYDLSYERISLGANPKLGMQHAVGFRAYYDL